MKLARLLFAFPFIALAVIIIFLGSTLSLLASAIAGKNYMTMLEKTHLLASSRLEEPTPSLNH